MDIRLNHIRCRTLAEAETAAGGEVAAFLREWFSPGDTVSARTSGSTGAPQQLDLRKSDMRASARLTNSFFGITAGSTLLLCLSPGYIAGKMMIVRALEAGAGLVTVAPTSSPLASVGEPFDFAAMVPLQVQQTLDDPETAARLCRITSLIVGGAAVSPALESRLAALPVQAYATYGMTETVSHIALRRIGGTEREYTALGGVRFTLDGRGCLVIDAPHLSGRRWVTNDMVRLAGATRFEWLGRYDNVINSGGVKLFPERIEEALSSLIPARFFVTSRPDERLGERLVLVIEGETWSVERLSALRSRMEAVLSRYERPREMLFLPRFRETWSGKVIRSIDPE
ncbi:MAG: AMP-binding protein [Coprobacter sp.]|nr:AMP-binding protein [Coprobacter sp.]